MTLFQKLRSCLQGLRVPFDFPLFPLCKPTFCALPLVLGELPIDEAANLAMQMGPAPASLSLEYLQSVCGKIADLVPRVSVVWPQLRTFLHTSYRMVIRAIVEHPLLLKWGMVAVVTAVLLYLFYKLLVQPLLVNAAYLGASFGGAPLADFSSSSSSSTTLLQSPFTFSAPRAFICPIMFDIMTDPVSTPNGHTYERANISEWLAGHNTDPFTRIPLTSNQLTPNIALRDAIEEWRHNGGYL
jgi:hypothetical protein